MKPLLSLLILPLLAMPAAAQNIGDSVTPDALAKAEWVKGSAPSAWEPGKLYLLECWATWCGPCIAAIPHVDALYDKYHSQGLEVLGMDVFEDGKDKVEAFVSKKGDGMSYPVAYTGKGGAFEKEWLVPAGVNSIPRAFLVKDGKVLLTIHPATITEELIEAILAGGAREAEALAPLQSKQRAEDATAKAQKDYADAAAKSDREGMKKAIAALEAAAPESEGLSPMRLGVLILEENWDAAAALVKTLPDKPWRTASISSAASSAIAAGKAPQSFYRTLAENFGTVPIGAGGIYAQRFEAKIWWFAGAPAESAATIKKAIAACSDKEAGAMGRYLQPALEKTAKEIEAGRFPDDEVFGAWVKETAAALK